MPSGIEVELQAWSDKGRFRAPHRAAESPCKAKWPALTRRTLFPSRKAWRMGSLEAKQAGHAEVALQVGHGTEEESGCWIKGWIVASDQAQGISLEAVRGFEFQAALRIGGGGGHKLIVVPHQRQVW